MNYKCNECGKFIGYNDRGAMTYTPYGRPGDLEPPDELFICEKCWYGRPRDLTTRIAWIKPSQLSDPMGVMNLNRELHEALGLCWHEFEYDEDYENGTDWTCTKCGLKTAVLDCSPDYAADSRLVLKEMMKREDWVEFQGWCFIAILTLDRQVNYGIDIALILARLALNWLKGVEK